MEERFHSLLSKGFVAIHKEYNNHLYKRGEQVKLKKDSRIFEATINGVDADGTLSVTHALDESFKSGDVEWVI